MPNVSITTASFSKDTVFDCETVKFQNQDTNHMYVEDKKDFKWKNDIIWYCIYTKGNFDERARLIHVPPLDLFDSTLLFKCYSLLRKCMPFIIFSIYDLYICTAYFYIYNMGLKTVSSVPFSIDGSEKFHMKYDLKCIPEGITSSRVSMKVAFCIIFWRNAKGNFSELGKFLASCRIPNDVG